MAAQTGAPAAREASFLLKTPTVRARNACQLVTLALTNAAIQWDRLAE